MLDVAWVALGGALGAVSRYGAMLWLGEGPMITLGVNGLGCLAIGVLSGLAQTHGRVPVVYWLGAVGFLGAFTTFSAFGLETYKLLLSERAGLAMANIAAQLIVGLSAVAIGFWIGYRGA